MFKVYKETGNEFVFSGVSSLLNCGDFGEGKNISWSFHFFLLYLVFVCSTVFTLYFLIHTVSSHNAS